MKLYELWEEIKKIVPEDLGYPGDENGIIFGDPFWEVEKICVCVEPTLEIIKKACKDGINAIISHEGLFPRFEDVAFYYKKPVLFTDKVFLEKIKYLINGKIGVIRIHTPWDDFEGGNNDRIAEAIGKIIKKYKFARLVELEREMDFEEFLEFLSEKFKLKNIIYVGKKKKIKKVFVVSGAGARNTIINFASKISDCLLSSDLKKDSMIYAEDLGFPVIDIGHITMENYGIYGLYKILKDKGFNVVFYDVEEPRKVFVKQ